ncbi:MAG: glycosyltransferase family 4 protein [Dehalococcoidia bacterium]|jgi:glycosyltransferase involved in cell wall biosynthesis|nr:glycosyltransferase family 4 protein [Dehalococcoidia bacterium]
MKPEHMLPENTIFVLLSFEGPDPYSLAGGLGVRITHVAQTLARKGFHTHLFFIGDPSAKGEEFLEDGKLILHRWCQWISKFHLSGVYDGEYAKQEDFSRSIPPWVIERIIRPAVADGKLVPVLAEEWHTAEAACRLSEQLKAAGLRDEVGIFWNANNTFGFEHIDWLRLQRETTVTAVSRYMKHIMRDLGVPTLVIPNGIPEDLLRPVNEQLCSEVRDRMAGDPLLVKVARWDPGKAWMQSIEGTALLKENGRRPVFIARGGMEGYGGEVLAHAAKLGLTVQDVNADGDSVEARLEAIMSASDADVLNVKFHCQHELLRTLYHASDAVLANSAHEPFGLVGLEVMASGGVVFTGGTGEDYAQHFFNSIVLDTNDAEEIAGYLDYLAAHPGVGDRLRRAGQMTARQYTWPFVMDGLIERLESRARVRGALAKPYEVVLEHAHDSRRDPSQLDAVALAGQ